MPNETGVVETGGAGGTGGVETPPAQPTPSPVASPNPQGPAPANSGNEARDRGILADLQKERKARQTLEARIAEIETRSKTELDVERRRIQALTGITPQSPADQEAAEVRARFAQLYPDLAGLSKEDIEAFKELRAQSANLQAATENHWNNHGRVMLGKLGEQVAEAIGSDLNERQLKALTGAYIQAAEADPEFLKRHEQGDETLLAEFSKNWIEDWFEPARRFVTSGQVNRVSRPVPSGRGNARPVVTAKPTIDYKDPKSVEDAAVASFIEHGGAFGREQNRR